MRIARFIAAMGFLLLAFDAPNVRAEGAAGDGAADAETGAMRIVVVDEALQPIAGATVRQNHVYVPAEGRVKIKNHKYTTDEYGAVMVTWPGRHESLKMWLTKPGYAPMWAMWSKDLQSEGDQTPGEFKVKMEAGTTIGGVVADEAGQPIAGVRVEIEDAAAMSWSIITPKKPGVRPLHDCWIAYGDAAVVTDAQGRWTANNLPRDEELVFNPVLADRATLSGPIVLRLTHPDYETYDGIEHPDSVAPIPLKDLRAKTATIKLKPASQEWKSPKPDDGAGVVRLKVKQVAVEEAAEKESSAGAADEVAGVVVDEQYQPIAGVDVDLWTWYPGNETTTDGKGRFRVKARKDGGPPQMEFTKAGYSPNYIENLTEGRQDMVVVLDSRTYLEGVLRDRRGSPVAKTTIRADHPARNQSGNVIGQVTTTATTDAAGRYKMFVFPETYDLQVVVPGSGAVRMSSVTVTTGERRTLDIQLEEAVRFEARVVDATTMAPVAGLVLWDWRDPAVKGMSDKDGRIVIDGMLPGKYAFNVGGGDEKTISGSTFYDHGEFGRWWSADAVNDWERRKMEADGWQRNFDDLSFALSVGMQPVTIEVERGVTFTGHVFDPDGKPVEGATVAPAKTGSGNSLTGDTRYSVRTKADGGFRAVMPAGNGFKYNLIAHDGDHQEWRKWANGVSEVFTTKPGELRENVDLTLAREATVRGRLLAGGGQSPAGQPIRAFNIDAKDNRYYVPDSDAKTNERGEFELKFLRPGKYVVQASEAWIPGGPAQDGAAELELAAGDVRDGVEVKLVPPQVIFFPAGPQRGPIDQAR